ncbi:class 1 fructose-bisphosphatase [Halobaculum magnesiiphilum]|uniref:Fructose-1,6-bisphosphatase class 1 n=1 Tax=Halobaculum magnesiiphilum TaxID=1017351 RepID=A0A8T8WE10_9EURY|nr:class 1 fructose-bisphosphatase [Halobaculum magnesiiphilum]QZP38107.1 fructose-1,6-bisphosphatase [Halobaculum magnesiiphilum]
MEGADSDPGDGAADSADPDAVAVAETTLEAVAAAAPEIRAGLPGRRRYLDDENPSGEDVLAADVYADELLEATLGDIDGVGTYASEERESTVDTGDGAVSVAVDPLDGSSNLESNNPMGTVVAIYDGDLPASGRDLVGAGFVLYGPVTTMVAGVGAPADATIREYLVTGEGDREKLERIELPDDPTVYGFGGRVPDWPDDFATYVDEIEDELKLRYGGAMIADVSQVLSYGGVFAYPALESAPDGKLRLQFEGNPVAYLVEGAGGRSSDGARSLLDVEATGIHQRVPVHVGNEALIERLEAALDEVPAR